MGNALREAPILASRIASISATVAVLIGADSFLAWSAGGGTKKRVEVIEDTEDHGRIIRDLLASFDWRPQTLRQTRSENLPRGVSFNAQGVSAIRLWATNWPQRSRR